MKNGTVSPVDVVVACSASNLVQRLDGLCTLSTGCGVRARACATEARSSMPMGMLGMLTWGGESCFGWINVLSDGYTVL